MRRHGGFRFDLKVAAAIGFCLLASVVGAADDNKIIFPSGGAHPAAPAGGVGGTASTMTLVLAFMLAAAGAWMVWRNRNAPKNRESKNLTVEETKSLGNRQYLVVASYEGKKFLLGVCPGRIDMLAPLNERDDGKGMGQ